MDKKVKLYFTIGAIIVSILGTLGHFAYEWSGQNPIVGLFTSLDESVWEHIKLLFFPMLVVGSFLVTSLKENYPAVLPGLLAGNLAGCIMIPVIYYTYSSILGRNISWIDISIYYICVSLAFAIAYDMTINEKGAAYTKPLLLATALTAAAFILKSLPLVLPA
ncbi:MAG: hypothetical protein IJ485_07505 [Lachnospiraceae bacterium]|nr:hypothetical protein [Lachnospiraceae bacterium]